MHSVSRKSPSAEVSNILDSFRKDPWVLWEDEPYSQERWIIKAELKRHFSGMCAYCERRCRNDVSQSEESDDRFIRGTTDHFRPRNGRACAQYDTRDIANCKCMRSQPANQLNFQAHSCEWDNLMYACYRCNQIKGNCWPIRRLLGRQVLAEGFPNPGARGLPERIFRYDVRRGLIEADEDACSWEERQLARHLIDFLNLDSDPENYPDDNGRYCGRQSELQSIKDREKTLPLPRQRLASAANFVTLLQDAIDEDRKLLWDLVDEGGIAFPSFVREYVRQEHPELMP